MNRQRDKFTASIGFFHGAKDCAMVSIAGGLFGFVFGILSHAKGFSAFNAGFMSTIVYAGSVQMIALSIWDTQHLALAGLLMTAYMVSLRFLLMGATLQPLLKGTPALRAYLGMFILVDENWALTLLKHQKARRKRHYLFSYYLGSGLIFYLTWIASSILGNVMGDFIDNPAKFGFDFAFVALFLALLMGVRRGRRDILPWATAAIVAIFSAHVLPGAWYIMLGALSGSIMGVLRDYH